MKHVASLLFISATYALELRAHDIAFVASRTNSATLPSHVNVNMCTGNPMATIKSGPLAPPLSRRSLLAAAGVAAVSSASPAAAASQADAIADPKESSSKRSAPSTWSETEPMDDPETAFLRSRLNDVDVKARFKALPFSPNQLYYPAWFFGEFQVTSVLKKKTFPLGVEVLPRRFQRGTFRCGYRPALRVLLKHDIDETDRMHVFALILCMQYTIAFSFHSSHLPI